MRWIPSSCLLTSELFPLVPSKRAASPVLYLLPAPEISATGHGAPAALPAVPQHPVLLLQVLPDPRVHAHCSTFTAASSCAAQAGHPTARGEVGAQLRMQRHRQLWFPSQLHSPCDMWPRDPALPGARRHPSPLCSQASVCTFKFPSFQWSKIFWRIYFAFYISQPISSFPAKIKNSKSISPFPCFCCLGSTSRN